MIKFLEIFQLKDRASFLREADFGDFGVTIFTEDKCRYIHLRDHIMK